MSDFSELANYVKILTAHSCGLAINFAFCFAASVQVVRRPFKHTYSYVIQCTLSMIRAFTSGRRIPNRRQP